MLRWSADHQVAPRGRPHVPVLMYHSVSADASAEFRPYAIPPRLFREHMTMLHDAGYEALTVTAYVRRRAADAALPERAVVLTFDDAFDDFRRDALPVLADLGYGATMYVPTAFVGSTTAWLVREHEPHRPVLSWSGLAEIASAGIEIGSHSRTHADLDLLDSSELRREVEESRAELEQRLEIDVRSFAYPFGHHGPAVRAAVRRAGYTSGVAVRDLSSGWEDDFAISRWTVRGDTTTAELRDLLERRSGRRAIATSDARALVSTALRRRGYKRRFEIGEPA